MELTTRELTPELWPAFEALFGERGACGGCWCMWWRLRKGEDWKALKGAGAKARMRALVEEGRALGILAFAGEEPVGWCSFGPRRDYERLDRAPSLRCGDADQVWSIPCFFVRAGWRRQGVAGLLLRAALGAMQARGVALVEGYPVRPSPKPMPGAFAWTGTRSLFDAEGFELAGNEEGGKQRVRRRL